MTIGGRKIEKKKTYEESTMIDPLPELDTRNLGSGSVLHQVIDRNTPVARHPSSAIRKSAVKKKKDPFNSRVSHVYDIHKNPLLTQTHSL